MRTKSVKHSGVKWIKIPVLNNYNNTVVWITLFCCVYNSALQTEVSSTTFTYVSEGNPVGQPVQTNGYRNGDAVLIQSLVNGALVPGYLTIPQVRNS